MFNNVNAKKRLTQVIVAFVIICMTFTGSFLLLDDTIRSVSAETYDWEVENATDWASKFGSMSSGNTYNVTLTGNIEATSVLKGVPAGATVNLIMNGKTISWNSVESGNEGIMSTSYPFANTYWGLITNEGTLTIEGTGNISIQQVRYDYELSSTRDNYGVKVAAIVNSGKLIIGSRITITNYIGMAITDGDEYQDMFLYAHGVYNTGTVESSGNINVSSYAGGMVESYGSNAWSHAFAYGIYGGNVDVKGGNITVDARSGFLHTQNTGYESGNKAFNYAVGVFSDNATITGVTKITTNTKSWRNQEDRNIWSGGANLSWSVGVMYTKTHYPVIGAAVNISSTTDFVYQAGEQVAVFPGSDIKYTVGSGKTQEAETSARRAYPVAGINKDANAAMYGGQSTETDPNGGGIFGTNSSNVWYNADSFKYYGEMPYRNNQHKTGNASYVATNTSNVEATKNSDDPQTATITNGAPGENGAQYIIVYRYYQGSKAYASNLTRVSYAYDPAIVGEGDNAVVKIGSTDDLTGVVTDYSNTVAYSKGGVPENPYFYSFEGASFERITPQRYVNRKIETVSDWSGGSVLQDSGETPGQGNIMIVYMDYIIKTPSVISVVATNKGTPVAENSGTTISVPYTGANLVVGSDFNLGIFDTTTGVNVVEDYNYKNEAGSAKTRVNYAYYSKGSTGTPIPGLPKDVGTYIIEVSVEADDKTYNRQAKQERIECTITPGNVTISGGANSINLTYGESYSTIFDKYDFKAVNASDTDITSSGAFTVSGNTLSALPNAGTSSITIRWTPNDASYNVSERTVTLNVAKKEIKVGVAAKTVTYGDALPASSFELTYSTPIVADDSTKLAGWLAATTFEVEKDGVWQAYGNGLPAGEYNFRISAFGGASDSNYTFVLDTNPVKLTVAQRAIQYTAAATDRVYEKGNKEVFVTLSNPTNAYGGDSFSAVINTKGTVDENAGKNKVTVDVNNVDIGNKNYYLVIVNADILTANIAKANPTGVYVAAANPNIVYNKTQTLASVALSATENPEIPGTWAWVDPTIVPTVKSASESKYLAKFTPASDNYNTCEQEVTLIVDKAVVQIVVDADSSTPDTFEPFNVTYGDAVPALKQYMKYIGFTGDDTIDTVPHDGNADISTDYNPTSGVREGGYTVSVNENIIADNYDFVTVNNKIIVSKKALTITANDRTITYGDKEPSFKATDVTATGFANNETISALGATFNFTTDYRQNAELGKVGSYDIDVEVVTSNNNYDITCVSGTLTVEKKTLTLTPVAKTIDFGRAIPEYKTPGTDYTVDGLVNGDTSAVIGGTFKVKTAYTSGSYVNTYAVTADVSGMTADNYKFAAGTGTLTVVKAVPSITTAPNASVVNSHTLADATFDNSAVVVNPNNSDLAVAGTFKFNSTSTTPVWGSTTAYTATFTPADDINYTTTTVNVVVEVTVKTISGIPVIQGSAMVGSELSVSLASVDPNADVFSYQWYRVNGTVAEAISDATESKYTVTEDDLDKAIYVVITADTSKGFSGSADSEKTSKVIEALLETTRDMFAAMFPNNSTEVVYNANVYEVTVNVADAFADHIFGDITVKYNGSTTKPENAGTYNVTIDVGIPSSVTGKGYDDGYEYQAPVSGMLIDTLVIKPATLTANIFANDKIYDGTVNASAHTTFSGVYEEDVIILAPDAKYTFDNKDAGTDKKVTASNVVLTGDDAGNYVIDETTLTTTASILPREIYFIAEAKKKTYDKSATVEVQFEYDDITGKNDSDKSTGYAAIDNESTIYLMDSTGLASSINVGENIALVNGSIEYEDKLAGSSSGNYIAKLSNEDSVRVEIIKANPVVVAPVITEVYGPTKTLGQINLKNYATGDGYWEFIDTSIVPTRQVKTYAARFVPADLNNYNILEPVQITVDVTPLEVTLKADDKSVTYGANAPTYTFKPTSGITEDILATIGGSCKAVCYEYTPGTDVGVYEIVLNAAYSDPNYTFKTESGWLTVARATINVAATAENKVYDGFRDVKVNFAIQSGVYSADVNAVDLSVKSTTGTTATQNAGVTKVVSYEKPVLVGGKAGNYILNITPIEGALAVEILKADITGVEFPSGAQVEFGYDLTNVTFENPGDAKGGSFAYENAKITVPGKLGVYDTYKVIYTPADAINYNTQEAYVTLQVVKCTLNYVVGVAGNLQSGQTLTAVTTGLPAAANDYICYQWYRADGNDLEAIKGATGRTYIATDADVGYTLVVMTYFNDNDPFVFADDSFEIVDNIKGVIGQSTDAIKEIALTFWQRIMNWLYRILAILTGIQLNGGLGIGG